MQLQQMALTLATLHYASQAGVSLTILLIQSPSNVVKTSQVLYGRAVSSPATDGVISLRMKDKGEVSYTSLSLSGSRSGLF